jgi:hypothetical protein
MLAAWFFEQSRSREAKEGEGGAELREKNVMKDKFSTYCLDCAH